MVSRKLMGFWALMDVFLLAAGGLAVALAIVWRSPDLIRNMTLGSTELTGGLILGITLLVTFAVSIGAIIQANHVTIGLVILNYFLLFDAIMVIVLGTMLWFPSLTERNFFHGKWLGLTPEQRVGLQDQFSCCGYFNASDTAEVAGTFCTQPQVDFLNALDLTNDDNAKFFCVQHVTEAGDAIIGNVFTGLYSFMVPVLCLLLASVSVIFKREEDERFKKIDGKRGGRGFV
jgi:hypothetical protein